MPRIQSKCILNFDFLAHESHFLFLHKLSWVRVALLAELPGSYLIVTKKVKDKC